MVVDATVAAGVGPGDGAASSISAQTRHLQHRRRWALAQTDDYRSLLVAKRLRRKLSFRKRHADSSVQ